MKLGMLWAFVLFVLFEGCGQWLFDLVHRKDEINMSGAPFGAALIFCVLELFYLPALVFQLSFGWIKVATMIVLSLSVIPLLVEWKSVFKKIFSLKMLFVLGGLMLMAFIFFRYGIDKMLKDEQLKVFIEPLITNKVVYPDQQVQGYLPFCSLIMWGFNENFIHAIWMLSMLSAMVSMVMGIDFITGFHLKDAWFEKILIIFVIFYCGFSSGRIIGGFHGEYWGLSFIAELMFCLYHWIKSENDAWIPAIVIMIGAGLTVRSASIVVSLEILYCLAVYLFRREKVRTVYNLTTFVFPLLLYASAAISMHSLLWGILFLLVIILFYMRRKGKHIYRLFIRIENHLIMNSFMIFLVVVPLVFIVLTIVLWLFGEDTVHLFSRSYFQYLMSSMAFGLSFLRGNLLSIIVDSLRWLAVIYFLLKAKNKEEKWIRILLIGMLVLFVNPIMANLLTEVTGITLYADSMAVLFNPFMDVLFFITLQKVLAKHSLRWVLPICLIIIVLMGQIGSYFHQSYGLYDELVHKEPINEVSRV